jgi:hypothetical protein
MSGDAVGWKAMKWVGRVALAAVALALVLAALVAFLVPGILRSQAAGGMETATGRKLAIGAISINPFTWNAEFRDVSLSEPGGTGTFASFKTFRVAVSPSSLWRGAPIISHVRLESPHFNVVRTGPNAYNLSDLIKYLTMPIPALSLNDVRITGGSIDFLDQALVPEERHTVREAEMLVPFLTTIPHLASEYGTPHFSALIDGAPLVVDGRIRGLPKAVEATLQVDLKDVSLPVYRSYLAAWIPMHVDSGKVSVQGTASYRTAADSGPEAGWDGTWTVTTIKASDEQGPLRVEVGEVAVRSRIALREKLGMILEGGTVEVRDFSVPFGAGDGITVGLLSIQGAAFTEKENLMEVAAVLLDKGSIRLSRDRKGIFSHMALLESIERRLPRTGPGSGEPVRWRVGKIEGKGIDATFTDGTRKELPRITASRMNFLTQDLAGPIAGPMSFTFAAEFGEGTALRASGRFVPTPLAVDVDLDLRRFSLVIGGPYLPEGLGLVIANGHLDAKMAVALATRHDRLSGTFGGNATVRSLKLLDRRRGKLLAWKVLTVDRMKGNVAPMSLRMDKVVLTGLRADVVMDKDGTLNLPGMARQRPEASGDSGPKEGEGEPGFKSIRLDALVLGDGAVTFTDEGVPGGFRGAVRDISARATGISSEAGKIADVDAQAILPGGAPLHVKGKAAFLGKPAFADLGLTLEKLDLSTASPYSGTYLGLEVDRGSLTVKSRAKIDQGKLAAENRIRVEQLTFGKSVKSDKATILPVQLLIDILRDKNGDIVLDLPISASTDDDNLAGSIVMQAAMGVVFPPGSPLRSIAFADCSTDLSPEAQDRLRKLAGALQERAAMKIHAVGYVDQEADGKACRERDAVEKSPSPPLEGDARMKQLAEGRAAAVRGFLVDQGKVAPTRVSATTGDVYGAPKQKDDRRARVEFARATD